MVASPLTMSDSRGNTGDPAPEPVRPRQRRWTTWACGGLLVWVTLAGLVTWDGLQEREGITLPLHVPLLPGRSLLIWTIFAPRSGYGMVNSAFYGYPHRSASTPWIGVFYQNHTVGHTTRLFATTVPDWPATVMRWFGIAAFVLWGGRTFLKARSSHS